MLRREDWLSIDDAPGLMGLMGRSAGAEKM